MKELTHCLLKIVCTNSTHSLVSDALHTSISFADLSPGLPPTALESDDGSAAAGSSGGSDQALMSVLGAVQEGEEQEVEHRRRRQREESDRIRREAVEALWRITEELNVLYKENWTAMADGRLARFQRELLAVAARGGKEVRKNPCL